MGILLVNWYHHSCYLAKHKQKGTVMTIVTIDDKEYETDDMSDDARAQLVSLQFVSAEIPRLQAKVAAMQTASNAYSVALGQALNAED